MLKNYVVKMENVEVGKQQKIVNYMVNEEHKNHTNTQIFCDSSEEEYKLNLLAKLHSSQMNYAKNKKGGRPLKRIAKSLTFNIPKYFNCSDLELKNIDSIIKMKIIELLNKLGIDLQLSDLFSASHFQDNKHIHLIIPMIDNQGKNIRHFNSKSFLTELKVIFTETVDNTLNTDIKEVKTLTPEEQAHNKTIKDLEALIIDYQYIINTENLTDKAIQFMNNSIIQIKRLLEHSDSIKEVANLDKINKNIDKVNKSKAVNKVLNKIG